MKKIIYLTSLIVISSLHLKAEEKVYIYRNYESSIIRQPYPKYVIQNNYIYRTYPNSIIRQPYPEYTIKNSYIYKNYDKSIIRKPYPLGSINDGIPD